MWRPDLQVQAVRAEDATFYDVFDPLSGQAHRLYEAEYEAGRRLDGRSGPSEIVVQLHAAGFVDLGLPELAKVEVQLRSMGLLQAAGPSPAAAAAPVGGTATGTHARAPQAASQTRPRRGRRRWAAATALLLLTVLGGGAWWRLRPAPPPWVEAQTLQAYRVPLFATTQVLAAHLAQDRWLSFDRGGPLNQLPPAIGTQVAAGDILAALQLPAPQRLALAWAQRRVLRLRAAASRTTRYLNQLLGQRQALSTPARRGGAAQLGRRERRGRASLARLLHAAEGAEASLRRRKRALRHHLLLAPFAGEVAASAPLLASGRVAAHQALLRLRDPRLLRLSLQMEAATAARLPPGSVAQLSLAHATPQPATVERQLGDGRLQLTVPLDASQLAWVEAQKAPSADAYRLVERMVEGAFLVPRASLLLGPAAQVQLLRLQDGRVWRLPVQVVEQQEEVAFIQAPQAQLGVHTWVVVRRQDGAPLAQLRDGAPVRRLTPSTAPPPAAPPR